MILQGDSAVRLKELKSVSVDLTVTSPPYDKLRSYDGNSKFDVVTIIRELYRVTKIGGVVVWVTGDQTIDFDESGTSFETALLFKKNGWKLHDTMIFVKKNMGVPSYPTSRRYVSAFEYMFVFCKGYVKTWNPIKDKINRTEGSKYFSHSPRDSNDKIEYSKFRKVVMNTFGLRSNVWVYDGGYGKTTIDKIAYEHPAVFPESLAYDHIRSWSNKGDTVLDPFLGSGTTYKMALKLDRIPIGIEINPKYVKIAQSRLRRYINQKKKFGRLLD